MRSSTDEQLVERIGTQMSLYFGQDVRRIDHARRVAHYAERLLGFEEGRREVVLSAAYLHDIGIKEAERKYSSTAARYQHQEGPPIAREILTAVGAGADLIDEVCDIVGHHHNPRPQETRNFKVVYDADLIVNLEDKQKEKTLSPATVAKLASERFLTAAGQELGRKLFIERGTDR